MQIVTISTQDLQTMLNNCLEPIVKELEEAKANISLLTERYMNSKELAEYFKKDVQTIRRMANDGKIPYYMLGSEMRFKISEVNKAMKPIKKATP